jgi:hypothetical protein
MSGPIYVSQGMARYVGGTITETTGKDISSATFQVALGSSPVIPPTVWVTPDVSAAGASPSQRVVKLLVTSPQATGDFWLWAKIADSPEIEPVVFPEVIPIA